MFVSWLISIEQNNNQIEEEGLVIFAIKFHKMLNSWMFILQTDHKLLGIFDSKTDDFCTYIIWGNDFKKLFTTVRCHTLYLFIY